MRLKFNPMEQPSVNTGSRPFEWLLPRHGTITPRHRGRAGLLSHLLHSPLRSIHGCTLVIQMETDSAPGPSHGRPPLSRALIARHNAAAAGFLTHKAPTCFPFVSQNVNFELRCAADRPEPFHGGFFRVKKHFCRVVCVCVCVSVCLSVHVLVLFQAGIGTCF